MLHSGGSGRVGVVAIAVVALLGGSLLAGCDTTSSTLTRPADPVVLTGAALPQLVGVAPADIVAFRLTGTSTWTQVPVQVDERKQVDLGTVYGQAASGVVINAYADPGTLTGADPTTAFDADDELVFMASDAGGSSASAPAPAGVVAGSGVDVKVTDPLASGKNGHVYLFRRAAGSGLVPSAGTSYVSYSFSLAAGPYLTSYKFQDGPNPENSTITTASYRRHFSDRWLGDQMAITAPGATGVDILERNKARFAPGYCGRSEDTFDDAEGAFIANRSGPVRAIRSYIGANSGPWTQRDHLFYASREDVVTRLRVHSIPGIMDYLDLSHAAIGMTYRNNANQAGVTVDGTPDTITPATLGWESLDGPQGSVVQGHAMTFTGGTLGQTSWYEDDSTPPDAQCTGDSAAIGQSGPRIGQTIPCTDPEDGCTATLTGRRSLVYGPPGVTAAAATEIAARTGASPTATATTWPATG